MLCAHLLARTTKSTHAACLATKSALARLRTNVKAEAVTGPARGGHSALTHNEVCWRPTAAAASVKARWARFAVARVIIQV